MRFIKFNKSYYDRDSIAAVVVSSEPPIVGGRVWVAEIVDHSGRTLDEHTLSTLEKAQEYAHRIVCDLGGTTDPNPTSSIERSAMDEINAFQARADQRDGARYRYMREGAYTPDDELQWNRAYQGKWSVGILLGVDLDEVIDRQMAGE